MTRTAIPSQNDLGQRKTPHATCNMAPVSEGGWTTESWKLQAASEHPELSFENGGIAKPAIKFCFGQSVGVPKVITHEATLYTRPYYRHRDIEVRFYNLVIARGGKLSFEDLIEYCDFPNKEAILQLWSQQRGVSRTTPAAPLNKDGSNTDLEPTEGNLQGKGQGLNQGFPTCPYRRADPKSTPDTPAKTEPVVSDELVLKQETQPQTWSRRLLKSRVADISLGM